MLCGTCQLSSSSSPAAVRVTNGYWNKQLTPNSRITHEFSFCCLFSGPAVLRQVSVPAGHGLACHQRCCQNVVPPCLVTVVLSPCCWRAGAGVSGRDGSRLWGRRRQQADGNGIMTVIGAQVSTGPGGTSEGFLPGGRWRPGQRQRSKTLHLFIYFL